MHPIDIRKYKIELRERCRNFRKNLDPAVKAEMDLQISQKVKKLYQYRAAQLVKAREGRTVQTGEERLHQGHPFVQGNAEFMRAERVKKAYKHTP